MKLHALTKLGNDTERRRYFRRDANCPVLVRVRLRQTGEAITVGGSLVNISEDGCLVSSQRFPWRDDLLGIDGVGQDQFSRLADDIQLAFPWAEHRTEGLLRKQGNYTLHIQFTRIMAGPLVDRIARMEPAPGPASPA